MAENSAISWTTHTWNPWMGCTKVSPACDGCYAEALMDKRYGKVKWGNHPRHRTGAHTWNDPFRWQKQAEKDGDRPFVFCASLADIFDNQVDPQWRADAFDVMRQTPRLVYLLLTKRPQNIVKLSEAAGGLPQNAAIGATCEDQKRANINVPALLDAKGIVDPAFTFLSCEPLLSHIQIAEYLPNKLWNDIPSWKQPELDWVITGGETDQGGHKARPTKPDWIRSLRDQCAAAGVPFHHKQNGEWVSVSEVAGPGEHFKFEDGATVRRIGKRLSGRTIDGVEHNAFPIVRP
ncbi:MAG: phage Gp37/Gp68 family protein [Shinella sp.]|nr:phage Gp37/Gp68 family protein [Shinella sp.]